MYPLPTRTWATSFLAPTAEVCRVCQGQDTSPPQDSIPGQSWWLRKGRRSLGPSAACRCSSFPFTAFTMFHSLLFLLFWCFFLCNMSFFSYFFQDLLISSTLNFLLWCALYGLYKVYSVCYLPIISCLQMYIFHETGKFCHYFCKYIIFATLSFSSPSDALVTYSYICCTVFVSSDKSLRLC